MPRCTIVLLCAAACVANTRGFSMSPQKRYPTGSYFAEVRTAPLMPKQKILITILSRSNASIRLSGLVEMQGSFRYGFCPQNDEWWSSFDAGIVRALRKWRCTLEHFTYDQGADAAVVDLRLPVMGRRNIVIKKAT